MKIPDSYRYLMRRLRAYHGKPVTLSAQDTTNQILYFYVKFEESDHHCYLSNMRASDRSVFETSGWQKQPLSMNLPEEPLMIMGSGRENKNATVRFSIEGLEYIPGIEIPHPCFTAKLTDRSCGFLTIDSDIVEIYHTMFDIEEADRDIAAGKRAEKKKPLLKKKLEELTASS